MLQQGGVNKNPLITEQHMNNVVVAESVEDPKKKKQEQDKKKSSSCWGDCLSDWCLFSMMSGNTPAVTSSAAAAPSAEDNTSTNQSCCCIDLAACCPPRPTEGCSDTLGQVICFPCTVIGQCVTGFGDCIGGLCTALSKCPLDECCKADCGSCCL